MRQYFSAESWEVMAATWTFRCLFDFVLDEVAFGGLSRRDLSFDLERRSWFAVLLVFWVTMIDWGFGLVGVWDSVVWGLACFFSSKIILGGMAAFGL